MTCYLRRTELKAQSQASPQGSTELELQLRVNRDKSSKYLRLTIVQGDSAHNVFKFYPGGLVDPMMSSLDNALVWFETSLSI